MIRSLFLKFGMLAVTVGVVLWIGWHELNPSLHGEISPDNSRAVSAPPPLMEENRLSTPDQTEAGTRSGGAGLSQDDHVVGSVSPRELLDLNSATAEELESLPGIGATLAQRVIEFRRSVGRFTTVEDLLAVKGIGERKFDRIKPLVTVAAVHVNGKLEKRPL